MDSSPTGIRVLHPNSTYHAPFLATPASQAALRDPTLADRINEEARLAVVAASSARLHAHRLGLRQRRAEALQARVARGGAEAGELAVAEVAAGTAYQVGWLSSQRG